MTLCMAMRIAGAAGTQAGGADHAAPVLRFDLPAQALQTALVAFGALTGYSVLVASQLTAGRQSAAVHGEFEPPEALRRLLAGTRLAARYSGADAFTLAPEQASGGALVGDLPARDAVPLGQGAYAGALQAAVTRTLCAAQPALFGRYRIGFQLWIGADGAVRDARLLESSGLPARDDAVLLRMRRLALEAPPPGLAQPVTILLTPRPDPAGDCRPFAVSGG